MKKSHQYNLIALMNNKLQRKYKNILSFYEVKPINQILSANPHCTIYMNFCDLKIDTEDVQYLKRVYYYRTLTGKPEIEHRMKILCQTYATNPALSTFTYQYPMMIITNTKSLFVRRKRRLRKIQAGQGSSDFTEQRYQQYLQLEAKSENFLQNLQNSLISESENEQQYELSFESHPYDVFSQALIQEYQRPHIKLTIRQDSIRHLIYDYRNCNENGRIHSNFDGELPSFSNSSKHAFTYIENQHKTSKESIVSITPIELERLKTQRNEKKSFLGDMIANILQRPINFSNIGLKRQNGQSNQLNSLGLHSQHQSLQNQKKQRASKRQKIREKAEELLKKVRNTTSNEQ